MARASKIVDDEAHELGGTLGMTVGGIAGGIAAGAAAGAASGAVAGPLGVVAGAAVGGAIGGKAGEAIAREINPTVEEAYWEENYADRPYVVEGTDFETYRPAYRHGIDSYRRYEGADYETVEPQLRRDWEARDNALDWSEAEGPSRDAYTRLYERERR
jgi:hypothetical protein